jgi:hypothetical protein
MRNINYFKMTGSTGNNGKELSIGDLTRVRLTNLDGRFCDKAGRDHILYQDGPPDTPLSP